MGAASSLLGLAVASDLPLGFEASLEKIAKGEAHSFVWPSLESEGTPSKDLPKASGKPAPDMKGGENTPVPEWQKQVTDHAGDSDIMGDIAAGAAIGELFGPEGAAVGAVSVASLALSLRSRPSSTPPTRTPTPSLGNSKAKASLTSASRRTGLSTTTACHTPLGVQSPWSW